MKYCPYCGKEVMEGAAVCLGCGRSLNNFNNNTNNYNPNPYQQNSSVPDAPSFGFAVLGFLIPVVGLILYLVWKDTTPLKAKSAGKGALISVIVSVVFSIIMGILFAVASVSLFAYDPMYSEFDIAYWV
ncbi:MAG: zinc ribbon domain-containing protein [Acutalibacteraceae bacterium]